MSAIMTAMTTTRLTKADRTRRDVLAAAIEVWAEDNTASLGDVADRAGVGRTTLNRYYPDRAHLLDAVDQECRARFLAAFGRSRPSEGPGHEALMRICTELIELGPVLALVFADNALVDPDTWHAERNDPLEEVISRGYADGTIDPELSSDWIIAIVWTSLVAAHLLIGSGARTRHEAAGLLTRTLTSGLGVGTSSR